MFSGWEYSHYLVWGYQYPHTRYRSRRKYLLNSAGQVDFKVELKICVVYLSTVIRHILIVVYFFYNRFKQVVFFFGGLAYVICLQNVLYLWDNIIL